MNKIIGNDSSRPALIAIAPAPDERHCQIKALVANVRHGLQLIVATPPQLSKKPSAGLPWVHYIVERRLACAPKPSLGLTALETG